MNKYISLLLLVFAPVFASMAQDKKLSYIVNGVPQHILNNAVRFELDIAQTNPNKWLVIAPQFYFKAAGSEDAFEHASYNKMIGGGLEVFSRRFLSSAKHGEGFYFSYGGGYKFLDLNTSNFMWETTTESGLDYYRRKPANYDILVHSISGRATVGYQLAPMPNLMGDVYIGFGVKYSIHDAPEGSYHKFNRNINDYGYTGTLFIAGLRVGIGW